MSRPAHRVDVTAELSRPVAELFALLGDHEQIGQLLGAKTRRIKDGTDAPNGLGSVREVRVGPLPAVEETVTVYELDRRIEYRITRGSPLRNHRGTIEFSETPSGGSRLHYVIEFDAALPLVGPIVRRGLERAIRRGLAKLR